MIHAYVQGNYVKLDNKNAGVRGESNVTALVLHFSPEWSDFSKRLLWKDSRGQKVVSVVLTPLANKDTAAGYPMEYHTEIPYEALAYMGWCSFIVEGFLPNDTAKVAKSVTARMYVQENEAEGDTPENTPAPTPSEIQQLQAAVDNAIGVAAADKAAAEQAAESAQMSASAASVNAKVAEDAAADASAAATRAYDYKDLSEQFSVLAGTHEANALQASIAAQNAQSAAESATAAAEKAKTGAETAKSGAEKAKSFAEIAKTNAETAKSQANTFAQNAAASATTAANAASAAQDAAVTAQNAKNASEQSAVSSSNSAKTSATNAITAVSNANEAGRSASAAKSSETNAKASETAAAKSAEEAAKAADAVKNGVQSDMAENDPTKSSHILNRTHWRELKLGNAIIDETLALGVASQITFTGYVADGLVEGKSYHVVWGTEEYDCVCGVDSGIPYIGNLALAFIGAEETDYPFCIECRGGTSYKAYRGFTGGAYACKVQEVIKDEWHKLNKNYLPDGAGDAVQSDMAENDPTKLSHILNRTHWKETENGVFLFEQEVSGGNYTYAETIGLDIGEVYEVAFAGYILDMVGVEYSANGEMGVTLKRIDGEAAIFEIVDYDPATAGKKGCAGRITTAGSSYSGQFVIFGNRVNWHRLDMRFMPHALGRVKTVNDQLPDQYGNVQIEVGGVKSVNGKTPDKNGNVEIEVGGGGGSARADLAENNPNAAGYVKNRTHWRELELGEAIIDTSVSLSFQTNKTVTGSVADGLTQGSTYRVMWGGAEYNCVCGVSGANEPYLGNLALHDTSAEASDDPFCIVSLGGASYKVIRKVPGTYTLTVQALISEVWHKLDKRYLPNDLGGVKTVNGQTPDENGNVEVEGVTDYNKLENKPVGVESVVLLPETTMEIDPDNDGQGVLPDVVDVQVGKTYTVRWNGTDYICTAQAHELQEGIQAAALGDLGGMTGGESTGEPFVVIVLDSATAAAVGAGVMFMALDGSASVTLSIIGEVVKKLDTKFLPEGYPSVEMVELLPETVLEDMEPMAEAAFPDVVDVKVGDTVTVKWNGADYVCMAALFPNPEVPFPCIGDIGVMTGGESSGEPFVILFFDAETATAMGAGIMLYSLDEATTVTFSIAKEVATKLAGKYLPDGLPFVETFGDDVLPETTVNIEDIGTAITRPIGEVVVGRKYNITLNGVAYPSVAVDNDDAAVPIKIVSDAEPNIYVAVFSAEATAQSGYTAVVHVPDLMVGEYTVAVDGGFVVHEIGELCLPDYRKALVIPFLWKERTKNVMDGQFIVKWYDVYTTSVTYEEAIKALEEKNVLIAEISDGAPFHFSFVDSSTSTIVFNYVQENLIKELRWDAANGIATLKERPLVERKWVRDGGQTHLGWALVEDYFVLCQGGKYYSVRVSDGQLVAEDITVTTT